MLGKKGYFVALLGIATAGQAFAETETQTPVMSLLSGMTSKVSLRAYQVEKEGEYVPKMQARYSLGFTTLGGMLESNLEFRVENPAASDLVENGGARLENTLTAYKNEFFAIKPHIDIYAPVKDKAARAEVGLNLPIESKHTFSGGSFALQAGTDAIAYFNGKPNKLRVDTNRALSNTDMTDLNLTQDEDTGDLQADAKALTFSNELSAGFSYEPNFLPVEMLLKTYHTTTWEPKMVINETGDAVEVETEKTAGFERNKYNSKTKRWNRFKLAYNVTDSVSVFNDLWHTGDHDYENVVGVNATL